MGITLRALLATTAALSYTIGANAATVAGPAPPTSDSGNSVLGAASLSVQDQLNLVTTSIFSGGTRAFNANLNVFISSTIAASKAPTSSSNRYQDSELLFPNGGILNLLISYGSVNINNYTYDVLAKNRAMDASGRTALSDRWYYSGLADIVSDNMKIRFYFPNGVGVRMVNRNTDSTQPASGNATSTGSTPAGTADTSNVSNYGVSTVAYFGGGFDGSLSGTGSETGNFRVEGTIVTSWTDTTSMHAMYPQAQSPKTLNNAFTATFQLSIKNSLSVNLHAGWPIGGSRGYEGKVLLAGITLNRPAM